MELNYKTIIDVLTPKKNIYTVFNSIITSEFTIYNSNCSLLKTIINCLKNDNEDEDKIKQNILNNLQNDYNNLNLKFKNKYSLKKIKDLINDNNNIYLHFICQYLKINIFIFNYKKNKIYSCYFGNYFNSLRETILFESEKFNPIIHLKKKSFNSNDDIINIILNNNIEYFENNIFMKQFVVKPIKEIYNDEMSKLDAHNDTIFIQNDIYTQEKLILLKKKELQNIIETKLNRNISNISKIKKQELINMILNNI